MDTYRLMAVADGYIIERERQKEMDIILRETEIALAVLSGNRNPQPNWENQPESYLPLNVQVSGVCDGYTPRFRQIRK